MAQIEKLEAIVKRNMQSLEGRAHSYAHVERVQKIATFLAEKEDAELDTVRAGSLLHDIGRAIGEPHAEKGVEPARRILDELNVPQEEANRILRIVRYHDVGGRERLETLEEKIVWDADKLDLIGLTGSSRAFYYAGETGRPFSYAVEWCANRSSRNPFEFFTETAQRIAARRYEAMKDFALHLENELSLKDIV